MLSYFSEVVKAVHGAVAVVAVVGKMKKMGLSERGVPWHPQILTDQLTLVAQNGTTISYATTTANPLCNLNTYFYSYIFVFTLQYNGGLSNLILDTDILALMY